MALPNNKITTTLVANTLGSNSRDVGTLCTHTAINKWSKWKPVQHATVSGITEAQLKSTDFGFEIPTSLDKDYLVALQEWEYNRPNSVFRLGDFRNYHHNAVMPVYPFVPASFNVINQSNNTTITAELVNGNDYQIGMSDFSGRPIGDFYLGVVIKDKINATYVVTATSTIAQGGNTIVIPNNSSAFNYDKIKIYFILSSDKIASVTELIDANILIMAPIPSETRYFEVDVIKTIGDLIGIHIFALSTTATSGFSDIMNYRTDLTPRSYFNTMGAGYFQATIMNRSNEVFTLNTGNVRIGVDKLITGSVSGVTSQPLMYDSSGAITSKTIAPNSQEIITFGLNNLYRGDTLPNPMQTEDITIITDIYYNSVWQKWGDSIKHGVRAM